MTKDDTIPDLIKPYKHDPAQAAEAGELVYPVVVDQYGNHSRAEHGFPAHLTITYEQYQQALAAEEAAVAAMSIDPVSSADQREEAAQKADQILVQQDIERRTIEASNYERVGVAEGRIVSNALPEREALERWATGDDSQTDAAAAAILEGKGLDDVETEMGNVHAMPAVESPSGSGEDYVRTRDVTPLSVTMRLRKEGRWIDQAENTRNELMKASRDNFATKEERQKWVYSELDRMYPPLVQKPPIVTQTDTISESQHLSPYVPTKPISESQSDTGQIQGLSDVPGDWPTLPSNASLGAELGWVQANRLWIVEERPGKATVVRLDKAASPAPSRAALGWLETSIRSYAKFVDVAAKVSGGETDEGAVMKRERKSVDEVRALLQEMKQAEGTCPHCGRPH